MNNNLIVAIKEKKGSPHFSGTAVIEARGRLITTVIGCIVFTAFNVNCVFRGEKLKPPSKKSYHDTLALTESNE